jgi:DHA1 family multidrug resistance protein-like MFS transporter/DHA1 family quinolone resistance protein-like MFS transporter
LTPDRRAGSLYAIAFVFSICNGLTSLLLPYVALRLGASKALTGWVGGGYMGGYMIACLLAAGHIDRIPPRLLLVGGNLGYILTAGLLAFTHDAHVLVALSLVYGMAQVAIWPTLMMWVSHGHEGPALNRRMGRYNVSWGTGMVVGPVIGGLFVALSQPVAFAILAGLHVVLLALAATARTAQPSRGAARTAESPLVEDHVAHPDADLFRLIARIAMACSFTALGLARFQFQVLCDALLISPTTLGAIVMILSLFNVASFGVLGKTQRWHYRASVLWAAQFVLAGGVASLYFAEGPAHLVVIAAVVGVCAAVTYTSSLYYGVSGRRDRGKMTAIHELLLSLGFVVGAIGSGYIAEWLSLRAIYPIYGGLMFAGIAAQVAVYLTRKPQDAGSR